MNRYAFLIFETILALALCHELAAQTERSNSYIPMLRSVINEEFSKDTRTNIGVEGDVKWEIGQITLSPGASISPAIEIGSWLRFQCQARIEEPVDGTGQRELRITFSFEDAADCAIAFRQTRSGESITTNVSVYDDFDGDGRSKSEPVRTFEFFKTKGGPIEIEYRNGLVSVARPTDVNEKVFCFLAKNYSQVNKLTVSAKDSNVILSSLTISGSKRRPSLSVNQRMQLLKVVNLANDGMQKLRDGKSRSAIDSAKQVVQICRDVYGTNHPDYGAGLNNLATLYEDLGMYGDAEPLYLEALEIFRQASGEAHPDYALGLGNLANMYSYAGQYLKAEPMFVEALEINGRVFGPSHPEIAFDSGNLAMLYEALGDLVRARDLHQQALKVFKQNGAELEVAITLNNLGSVFHSMRDYANAESYYNQSLEAYRKQSSLPHVEIATVQNNLANVFKALGRFDEAESYYNQAEKLRSEHLGEADPLYADSLNNRALLLQLRGEYSQARALFNRALKIYNNASGEDQTQYVETLGNLGFLQALMGEFDAAEATYLRTIAIKRKISGEVNPQYAHRLENLASLYYDLGNYQKAESLFRQARDIFENTVGVRHLDYANALGSLSVACQANKKFDEAALCSVKALGIALDHIDLSALIQTEVEQRSYVQALGSILSSHIGVALQDSRHRQSCYEQVLNWKGATLVRQRRYRQLSADRDLAELFEQLRATSSRLATLQQKVPDSPQKDVSENARNWLLVRQRNQREQIDQLAQTKRELERVLASKSQSFQNRNARIKLDDLTAALPKRSAMIDWIEFDYFITHASGQQKSEFEKHLAAFVIRPDRQVVLLDLGTVEQFQNAVEEFRRPWVEGDLIRLADQKKADLAGLFLRSKLWKPIESHLADVDLVLVSPDGSLGKLPIGVLPGAKKGSFLIEDYAFVSIAVPKLIPQMMQQDSGLREKSIGLLVVGGVDYDTRTETRPKADAKTAEVNAKNATGKSVLNSKHWPTLRETSKEIQSIEAIFRTATDLRLRPATLENLNGQSASKSSFQQLASQSRFVHVATHGYSQAQPNTANKNKTPARKMALHGLGQFQREVKGLSPGLLSGLVFAGANQPVTFGKDDGILTAEEIVFTPMEGVDTVVLSACETGLGEVAGGEGLIGLQRAFQVAGARSTVASLWKVNDEATQRLMIKFYENLWVNKMTKIESLRQAQLWMLGNPEATQGIARVVRGEDEEIDRKKIREIETRGQYRAQPRLWAAWVLSGDWR